MIDEYEISLEGDTFTIFDAPARFYVDIEEYYLPTHPDGPSRGKDIHVSVDLIDVKLGNLTLSREQLVEMAGEKEVISAEDHIRWVIYDEETMG